MVCKCGHDNFHVLKVLRDRRQVNGKFKVNDHIDSRIIICRLCGRRYLTETKITAEIYDKNYRLVIRDKDGEHLYDES